MEEAVRAILDSCMPALSVVDGGGPAGLHLPRAGIMAALVPGCVSQHWVPTPDTSLFAGAEHPVMLFLDEFVIRHTDLSA